MTRHTDKSSLQAGDFGLQLKGDFDSSLQAGDFGLQLKRDLDSSLQAGEFGLQLKSDLDSSLQAGRFGLQVHRGAAFTRSYTISSKVTKRLQCSFSISKEIIELL
ncbi:hypothetical protein DQG23_08965 [Paenibacillus contaminans]|uniref:Uncharacterized protein n=1 Tax=Paenibacillus contaminans TaxID=450362 RepID=A0A329MN80_9BACL|nr:hypothetical protein DQG23_08965 [Paenibacillus contaminans]